MEFDFHDRGQGRGDMRARQGGGANMMDGFESKTATPRLEIAQVSVVHKYLEEL